MEESLEILEVLQVGAAAILIVIIFSILSYGTINGIPIEYGNTSSKHNLYDLRIWVPRLFSFFGYSPLSNQQIEKPIKPASWMNKKDKVKHPY